MLLEKIKNLFAGLLALVAGRLGGMPSFLRAQTSRRGRALLLNLRAVPAKVLFGLRHSGDFVLNFRSMLIVVLKRLRHNFGLSVSAAIGIIAVLAMVVCVPVFSHAVSSEVLRTQLQEKAAVANRGLFSLHYYFLDKSDSTPADRNTIAQVDRLIEEGSGRLLGLPTERVTTEVQSRALNWFPVKNQYHVKTDEPWFNMSFFMLEDLPKHAKLVEGSWPGNGTVAGQPVQVAISETAANALYINVGDIYHYPQNLQIEVVGIWKANAENDLFWFSPPAAAYTNKMWLPSASFDQWVAPSLDRPYYYISWYAVMQENEIQFSRSSEYAYGLVRLDYELKNLAPVMINDYTPLEQLSGYQKRAEDLTTLVYAVGSPMLILALLFISLTATIAVQQYEQETATMRGRGASWVQVVLLNLIESIVLVLLAILPSIGVGWFAATLIDKSVSFLQFTERAGLPFSFQGINYQWIGGAVLVVIVSRLLPVVSMARTSIVRMKQEQSRNSRKPLWQRFYLDFLLLLPGLYAYLTMSGVAKANPLVARIQAPSTGQYRDILLYVAPPLFAMAMCMVILRILPLLLRALAWLVERFPKVWAYLSIQQIARRPQEHSSALLLIMISLSLAIFSASTAKTLDRWLHDSEYYAAGADLTVHEYVLKGGGNSFAPGAGGGTATTLSELDADVDSTIRLEEHMKLPSVVGVTRVGKYAGIFSYGVGDIQGIFMGIDRLDYPKVGFYRDDFSDQSFGSLMNALGSDLNAVLVPRQLAKEKGFRIGDRLQVSVTILEQRIEKEMVITGFYDYFATIFPGDKPTLIVNLDSIFDNPDSAVGYDIWLKLKPETEIKLVIYQLAHLIAGPMGDGVVKVRGNAYTAVKEMMAQPERVGIFGILNVGFLMTGMMPGIGFVLYSYASLRRRFIQLGILQAIGLSIKQLIAYLASEQFILMGVAILSGAGVGLLTSNLFVPFLQIGVSTGVPVPPFEVLIGWVESGILSLVFGLVLFLTMVGTIISLVRMKVFQAVKMGETL
jgi:putative ABC transport system permease protein